jgi:hypothetical protein
LTQISSELYSILLVVCSTLSIIYGDIVKHGISVKGGRKPARIRKNSQAIARAAEKIRKKRFYLKRLPFSDVLPGYIGFSVDELAKLTSMAPEEQKWRNSFFDSLIHDGLLNELKKLSTEELRRFVFMQKEEEGQWRDKLTQRKASREPQPETHIEPESWPDRLKSSDHQFIKKVSLQVPMHPQMREQVTALAASYGLGSGEFVEEIVAEKIAQSADRVKKGRELMAKEEFKRPYRAKLHVLRREIEELRQEKSNQRS